MFLAQVEPKVPNASTDNDIAYRYKLDVLTAYVGACGSPSSRGFRVTASSRIDAGVTI